MSRILYERRIQGGTLALVESNPPGETEIVVSYDDPDGGRPFKALAKFPPEAREIAKFKLQHARGRLDVEDLLREWSDHETWALWQQWWAGLKAPVKTRLIGQDKERKENTSTLLPLDEYDTIIVSFSGGKDSLACLLSLLEAGAPKDRIEIWHQSVDGRPGVDPRFFDWPCTESYCRAIAKALDIPIYFQWREQGFEGEITKVNRTTMPVGFELVPDGVDHGQVGKAGGGGTVGTRLKFPNPVANLMTRWCSSLLKIDVANLAFNNTDRFKDGKFLFITGERREESANRAGYAEIIEHRSTNKRRRVDHWRSILDWMEPDVWGIIKKFRVRPHPAYYLGWGRVSCFPCIFGSPNQWASVKAVDPKQFKAILDYEHKFGHTVQAGGDIAYQAGRGRSFVPDDPENLRLALEEEYPEELAIVARGEQWKLPAGALGKVAGSGGGPL